MAGLNADFLRKLKRKGFADPRIAEIAGVSEAEIRKKRHLLNIVPVYKRVDTCAAEFSSDTAYMYSSYDEECEANPTEIAKGTFHGTTARIIEIAFELDPRLQLQIQMLTK